MTDRWSLTRPLLPLACLLVLAGLAVLPMDAGAQLPVAVLLLGLMGYGRIAADGRNGETFRALVLVLGVFLTVRYILWRGLYTLGAEDPISLLVVLVLFAAELYAATIHVLGCTVNAMPVRRPLLTLADVPPGAGLPSVDVLVPSYDESPQLLEITLRAARLMSYPPDKLAIHLLDDGGTDQKIAAPGTAGAAARERRATLQALCRRLGVNYITRQRNERAKAGNINNALTCVGGDLVVVLDADHVPTVDFLEHTVPWFVRDNDVFLVQTPHFMVNPDPIDRNLLEGFRRMPSENEMFYRVVQRGLDFWSASFFCGSAAVLRRRHLLEVGGLAGDSITEDAETALALHSRGYRSVYVDRPMVAGLAPETFTAFVIQRMRWAQGMTQILLLKRPFLAPGLNWFQRIGYMSSILFWLFPFARVVFLLAPLAYLIFGLQVYNASVGEIIAYAVPHIIGAYMIADLLFGRTRWPLVSELYEVMQCLFSLVAVFKVFLNPRTPSFVVTPKGDTVDDDFISPLARPFYVVFALQMLGFAFGIWRLWDSALTRELTMVVLFWNLFNFVIVFAALGALLERRQRRASPRMPVVEDGRLIFPDGTAHRCRIKDLSAGGARLALDDPPSMRPGQDLTLAAWSHPLRRWLRVPLQVCAVIPQRRGIDIGVRFDAANAQDADAAVALAFGDSARWEFFFQRRSRDVPFGKALAMVLRLLWKPVVLHVAYVSRSLSRRFRPAAGELRLSE